MAARLVAMALLVATASLLLVATSGALAQVRQQSQPQPPPPPPPPGLLQRLAKPLQSLPAYFDFKGFVVANKRRYAASEQWLRKSLFLRNCLEVFKSRVDFRLGKTSYLRGVNRFADRRAEEIKRLYMSGPPAELVPAASGSPEGQAAYLAHLRQVYTDRESSERQARLEELASSATLEEIGSQDSDTSALVLHEAQARAQIEQMLAASGDLFELRAAIRDELDGNQLETLSQAPASGCQPRPLPVPGRARSPRLPDLNLSLSDSGLGSSTGGAPQVLAAEPYRPPHLDHCQQLDWSKHQCFHQVYDQGNHCGKCYVMASTALTEFYKCSEHAPEVLTPRKFSKDFVLDCGQKFAPTNLGCAGGSLLDTLRFVATAGAHNIRGWKQRQASELARLNSLGLPLSHLDSRCPLNQWDTPFSSWGEIPVELNPRVVPPNQWLEALEDGPLVVSVQLPDGLEQYERGVHEGEGCELTGNWHAMLLVGYGTSDSGVAYWRFRNSWGEGWGEAGHLNMAMSMAGACLAGGVRVYREPLSE